MSAVVPLKRVARINPDALANDSAGDLEFDYADLSSVDLEAGTVQARRVTFGEAPTRARRRTVAGDSLVPYLVGRSWLQTRPLLVSEDEAGTVFSTGFLCVRPDRNLLEPRYLNYVLGASNSLAALERAARGVTMVGFSDSDLGDLRIRLPALSSQRTIADFLDTETARIDALIAKKQRMRDLVGERRLATITLTTAPDWALDAVLHDRQAMPRDGWSLRSLKDLTDPAVPIVYGILLAGPRLDEGVPYLGAGDVRPDRMALEHLPRTSPEIAAEYPRSRIREGEIVYAIRGTFGSVELVPPELEGANLSRDVARICPASGVSPEWLLWALRSELAQEQFRRNEVGTAVTGVNIGDLKKVKLAVPPTLGDQELIAAQVRRATRRLDRLDADISRQLKLLREHRQALITAAVTGELEEPGAAA